MEVFYKKSLPVLTGAILFFSLTLFVKKQAIGMQMKDTVTEEVSIAQDSYQLLMNVNDDADREIQEMFLLELEKFVDKLARRQERYRSEERFIEYAFYKIHNRYLKNYSRHTDMLDLLEGGKYDCITGTAFYALIFDALGVNYTIHELPFHVYMTVSTKTSGKQLLLESTDGMTGFVSNPEQMAARRDRYAADAVATDADHYAYSFEIDEEINLTKLAALNYYNEAVVYYNEQRLLEARQYLQKARELYPAQRMEALRTLIEQVSGQQIASTDR
jgi:hypothetical protein